jgi:hypothetical protein
MECERERESYDFSALNANFLRAGCVPALKFVPKRYPRSWLQFGCGCTGGVCQEEKKFCCAYEYLLTCSEILEQVVNQPIYFIL